MKKFLSIALVCVLALTLFAGCGKTEEADTKIVVGASPTPHAEILEFVKEALADKGYEMEIVQYTDYVQPNVALDSGDLDANYFQHLPYLDQYNAENGTTLISAGGIHYEPLGLYPGKTKSIDAIAEGAQVAVPNDATNEARALLLLETLGWIKLNPEVGINATVNDITENPMNLNILEIEAAQLARSLADVDFAVINGNYAIQAGLSASTDALAKEEADSLAAETYANIIAVRDGEADNDKIKALIDVLQTEEVRKFLEETYAGAVIAKF